MRLRYNIPFTICLLLSAVLSPLCAQQPAAPAPTELVLSPRAVEQPLLKHRLLPAEYELRDGNAAPILLRLAWEQTKYFTEVVPTFEEHLRLPLNDPKLIEAGPLLKDYFFEEMRRAAHRRTAHWEYPIGEQQNLEIRLPDTQAARQIAGRGLSLWIRYHIATGKLNEAEEAIRVGFALNRHVGRTPFIVTQLITVALNNLLLQRLEELLAQPEAANYYWALSALPRPLVDFRPAVELEARNIEQAIGLVRLDDARTAQQWTDLDRAAFETYFTFSTAPQPADDEQKAIRRRCIGMARAELPAWVPGGANHVAAMSDSEAVVRWLIAQQHRMIEEIVAAMSLEPSAAVPALRDLQDRITAYRTQTRFPALPFAENPLNLNLTTYGLQRHVDALRAIEAIRHYAATHAGKLPESLDQITDTPAPLDPLTGKPFRYELANSTATLFAPGFPIDRGERAGINYRLTLRNPKP